MIAITSPYSSDAAVYVFIQKDGVWSYQAKLGASAHGINRSSAFGVEGVGVYEDTIIVSAHRDEYKVATILSGSAHVFVRDGVNWIHQRLVAPDSSLSFGSGVAIHNDTIVVGAPGDYVYGYASGAAYIFLRNGGDWAFKEKLVSPDGAERDSFGSDVDIDEDSIIVGSKSGAHIFARAGGAGWKIQAILPKSGMYESVGIHGDTVIVGVYSEDDNRGAAHVFVRNDKDDWVHKVKLASDFPGVPLDFCEQGDCFTKWVWEFGRSVAVFTGTIVVGSGLGWPIITSCATVYVVEQSVYGG
ncbi:hypothetical protein ACHAXR_012970 [Thalassiosira sp. AJA248-18]